MIGFLCISSQRPALILFAKKRFEIGADKIFEIAIAIIAISDFYNFILENSI